MIPERVALERRQARLLAALTTKPRGVGKRFLQLRDKLAALDAERQRVEALEVKLMSAGAGAGASS
jgi:hypothetical protein